MKEVPQRVFKGYLVLTLDFTGDQKGLDVKLAQSLHGYFDPFRMIPQDFGDFSSCATIRSVGSLVTILIIA